ncbi:hypothetical protein [Rothia aerolata]|uniref:DUF2797 domain-containing protein n=1 Tax=Rothia aerolata TaxID=1812262 RepID=A0A917INN6_9MICC|nr:hypothetical protein [Rothia aerolata]GGH57913.1 hypothetical protein GCM10007359_03550 [Rothia aerolata]
MQNLLFDQGNSPLIFRDLKWVDRVPHAVVETVEDAAPSGRLSRVELSPGSFLGFSTVLPSIEAEGLSTERYCAGYSKALVEGVGFSVEPCPDSAVISKGKQCARCEARDEFSAMHGIHRGAALTPAAESYASLEHWLYVATFPDGTSKVGTTSLFSKPRRLDEQAVACATYVAHATDGRQVRIWEDLVSKEAGLVQVKQVRSKYKAWTSPLASSELSTAHEKAVSLATWTLQEAALFEDFIDEEQLMDEKWQPSLSMNRAYESLWAENPAPLNTYSSLLDSQQGFYFVGATGKFAVVHFGNPDHAFLVNLAELQNRAILPHDSLTQEPQSQASLF